MIDLFNKNVLSVLKKMFLKGYEEILEGLQSLADYMLLYRFTGDAQDQAEMWRFTL